MFLLKWRENGTFNLFNAQNKSLLLELNYVAIKVLYKYFYAKIKHPWKRFLIIFRIKNYMPTNINTHISLFIIFRYILNKHFSWAQFSHFIPFQMHSPFQLFCILMQKYVYFSKNFIHICRDHICLGEDWIQSQKSNIIIKWQE